MTIHGRAVRAGDGSARRESAAWDAREVRQVLVAQSRLDERRLLGCDQLGDRQRDTERCRLVECDAQVLQMEGDPKPCLLYTSDAADE